MSLNTETAPTARHAQRDARGRPFITIIVATDFELTEAVGAEVVRRYMSRSAFGRMAVVQALNADAITAPRRPLKRRAGPFPTNFVFTLDEDMTRRLDIKAAELGMARSHYAEAAIRLALAGPSTSSGQAGAEGDKAA